METKENTLDGYIYRKWTHWKKCGKITQFFFYCGSSTAHLSLVLFAYTTLSLKSDVCNCYINHIWFRNISNNVKPTVDAILQFTHIRFTMVKSDFTEAKYLVNFKYR